MTSLASQTLRLARHEGMDAALKGLPITERKHIRAMLKPYHQAWWNPQAVWDQLPALLDALAHPQTLENAA
jgi:hypothetical protein